MSSGITQEQADIMYLQGNLGFGELKSMTYGQILKQLQANELPPSSWVLNTVSKATGWNYDKLVQEYRKVIVGTTCLHSFPSGCPYCKYGAE